FQTAPSAPASTVAANDDGRRVAVRVEHNRPWLIRIRTFRYASLRRNRFGSDFLLARGRARRLPSASVIEVFSLAPAGLRTTAGAFDVLSHRNLQAIV